MKVSRMYAGELLPKISALILHRMDGTKYEKISESGNDGITMNADSPWATEEMLAGIWGNLGGHRYQPYTLEQAVIDPAVEIGDVISFNGISERVYTMDIRFGKRVTATLGAPEWNECPHDYQPSASGGGGGGSAGKSKTDKEEIRFAREQLVADIGDVKSGLYAIASADDIEGLKEGNTTLFAKILDEDEETSVMSQVKLRVKQEPGMETASAIMQSATSGAISKIWTESYTTTNADGTTKSHSLAGIEADVTTIKGNLFVNQNYDSHGSAIATNGSIVAGGNLVIGGSITTSDGNATITIGSDVFGKETITFLNGTFSVLTI